MANITDGYKLQQSMMFIYHRRLSIRTVCDVYHRRFLIRTVSDKLALKKTASTPKKATKSMTKNDFFLSSMQHEDETVATANLIEHTLP